VVDPVALDVAAWGAQRLARPIEVTGGLLAQRAAVVRGLVARGVTAEAGDSRGALRLRWAAAPATEGEATPQ